VHERRELGFPSSGTWISVERPNGTLECYILNAGGDLVPQNVADPVSHRPRWAEEEATRKPWNGSRHCAHLLAPQRTFLTDETWKLEFKAQEDNLN
jgi:hypothetical protein